MINGLIQLANSLDDRGLVKEADHLDALIKKYAQGISGAVTQLGMPAVSSGGSSAAGFVSGVASGPGVSGAATQLGMPAVSSGGAAAAEATAAAGAGVTALSAGLVALGAGLAVWTAHAGWGAWRASSEAEKRATAGAVKNAAFLAATSSLERRSGGGLIDKSFLQQHKAAIKQWYMNRPYTEGDLLQAFNLISREEWLLHPVDKEGVSEYVNLEKARTAYDKEFRQFIDNSKTLEEIASNQSRLDLGKEIDLDTGATSQVKSYSMIKELIKLAHDLDIKGLTKEADHLDALIKKALWGKKEEVGGCTQTWTMARELSNMRGSGQRSPNRSDWEEDPCASQVVTAPPKDQVFGHVAMTGRATGEGNQYSYKGGVHKHDPTTWEAMSEECRCAQFQQNGGFFESA